MSGRNVQVAKRPSGETSSEGGETSRGRNVKGAKRPVAIWVSYLSEKSSDFDNILYTAADFELDERHVIKNEKFTLDRLRVRQNVFLVQLF